MNKRRGIFEVQVNVSVEYKLQMKNTAVDMLLLGLM